MKKTIKIISALLAMILIFSSCSLSKEDPQKKISALLEEKKYNDCAEYIKSLSEEEKASINGETAAIIIAEYSSLAEKISKEKIFDLTAYSKEFTENCRSLWNVASLLEINSETENYGEFIYLRYFAAMNDMMRYREICALLKAAGNSGYLEHLSAALLKYEKDGEYGDFENCYAEAEAFSYGQFDPGQYMVGDFRTAHDKIIKNLHSLDNGFTTDDTKVVASSVNAIKDSLNTILKMTDTVKAVYEKQNEIFNLISADGINSAFRTEITVPEQSYEAGMSFSLEYIFGKDPGFIDGSIIDEMPASDGESVPLEDAVEKTVKAINDTKLYKKELNITLTAQQHIKLNEFKSDNPTDNITKMQVNSMLEKSNGYGRDTFSFTDGKNGTDVLEKFIPPASGSASLNKDAVTDCKAVHGSGGYVITLTLAEETGTKKSPAVNIPSIVNGSVFDNIDSVSDYTTVYEPASIMVIINNDGLLSKLQYTVKGTSECIFTDEVENTTETKFSFEHKFMYDFIY